MTSETPDAETRGAPSGPADRAAAYDPATKDVTVLAYRSSDFSGPCVPPRPDAPELAMALTLVVCAITSIAGAGVEVQWGREVGAFAALVGGIIAMVGNVINDFDRRPIALWVWRLLPYLFGGLLYVNVFRNARG